MTSPWRIFPNSKITIHTQLHPEELKQRLAESEVKTFLGQRKIKVNHLSDDILVFEPEGKSVFEACAKLVRNNSEEYTLYIGVNFSLLHACIITSIALSTIMYFSPWSLLYIVCAWLIILGSVFITSTNSRKDLVETVLKKCDTAA